MDDNFPDMYPFAVIVTDTNSGALTKVETYPDLPKAFDAQRHLVNVWGHNPDTVSIWVQTGHYRYMIDQYTETFRVEESI